MKGPQTAQIWKFEIPPNALESLHTGNGREMRFSIRMPLLGSKVMCVQLQNNCPFIWVAVHPDQPVRPRDFFVRAAGEPLEFKLNSLGRVPVSYVGTFQVKEFVWHLFTRGEDDGTRQF